MAFTSGVKQAMIMATAAAISTGTEKTRVIAMALMFSPYGTCGTAYETSHYIAQPSPIRLSPKRLAMSYFLLSPCGGQDHGTDIQL